MNATIGEWVSYHPPKSVSFGHQSRIRDPRRAWPTTEQFLANLTDFALTGHNAELSCRGTDVPARLDEARQRFGPEHEQLGTNYRWALAPSQLVSAIEFALADDRFPKQETELTSLHFAYSFLWKEFERFPDQSINSDTRDPRCLLGIFLGGRRLFLQPHFMFPAPWDSHSLQEFIARIEPATPFRFRDQYFQRVLVPRGKGRWGRNLKLHKDWRATAAGFAIH